MKIGAFLLSLCEQLISNKMDKLTYKGTIVHIGAVQKINDKMNKRIVIVSDLTNNYPQEVPFEAINDDCDRLDNFKEGDKVSVNFDLRGRKWQDRWFGSLKLYGIYPQEAVSREAAPIVTAEVKPTYQKPTPITEDFVDDLPF